MHGIVSVFSLVSGDGVSDLVTDVSEWITREATNV